MLKNIYTTKMSANKKQLQSRFSQIRTGRAKASKTLSLAVTVLLVFAILSASVVMAALDSGSDRGAATLYFGGEKIPLKNAPFADGDMIYLPLRETFEKLGVFDIDGNSLLWDDGKIYLRIAVDAEKDPTFYELQTGSASIGVSHKNSAFSAIPGLNSDEPKSFSLKMTPPENKTAQLVGGVTYIPYTFAEYMLCRGLGNNLHNSSFAFLLTVNSDPPRAFVSQGFILPCAGEISNRFGTRENPVTGENVMHNGVDIAAAEGSAVSAAIDGTVTDIGFSEERGDYIVIECDNIKTVYTHLASISVSADEDVLRGSAIGTVGNSGKSTGAHLHFEVIIDGEYYDPELML